jgi:hypothetical protein
MKLPRLRRPDEDESDDPHAAAFAAEQRQWRDWYDQEQELQGLPEPGGSSPQAPSEDFADYENFGEVGRYWLKRRAQRAAHNQNRNHARYYFGGAAPKLRGRRHIVEEIDHSWWRPRWAVIAYVWQAPHEHGDPPDGRVLYDGPT